MTESEGIASAKPWPVASEYSRASHESSSFYEEYPFARSKMLEGYGADIERLLMERHVRQALHLGLNLPAIATALEDESLLTSAHTYAAWCEEWLTLEQVGSPFAGCPGSDLHALYVRHGDATRSTGPELPRRALKSLQLRRHARATNSAVCYLDSELDAICENSPRARLALEFARAMRRWYMSKAISDRRVQSNLAQIAVLR
jgi:hypothetical protein